MITAVRERGRTARSGRLMPSQAMSCRSGVRGEGASSVAQTLTEPVSAPNVWTGDELSGAGRWIIRFTEQDLADFERALAHVPKEHVRDVTQIRAEDFPLPHFRER